MMKRFIAILFFCLLVSGCGFHLRSNALFPAQLRHLYFFNSKPYSPLSVQMDNLFHAMNVTVVAKKTDARFSIIISQDHFAYSQPEIVNLSLPTNINFIQSAHVVILENNQSPRVSKEIIATHYFETARSLTLNANQIYTRNSNDAVRHELNRELSTLIYYWLISNDIKDAIAHANNTKTT